MVGGGVAGVGALVGEEVVGANGVRNPATLSLPPVNTLPVSEVVGVAPLRMAALISAAVKWGYSALYSAAAPKTCGAAIDVPLNAPYPLEVGSVDMMFSPGAPMSTTVAP